MDPKKIASEIIEAVDSRTNNLSIEDCREVLDELKSLCELRIMVIDDREVD